MFEVNDIIIYGTNGVCRIVDLEEKVINGVRKQYYVITPIYQNSVTIFAPADNGNVLRKMRKLLTEAEINALIDSMVSEEVKWITNENERKEQYKRILAQGNHQELIQMIKAIHTHKKKREAEGKRLHVSDDRFFKDAEEMLYNEFQYVLKLTGKEDLMKYILSRIGNGET